MWDGVEAGACRRRVELAVSLVFVAPMGTGGLSIIPAEAPPIVVGTE